METYVSTNKEQLDITKIHRYISEDSYWGMKRSLEDVQKTIDNSFCFGLYSETNEQLGFARVVTDFVVFAYVMDVLIFKDSQGKGLGYKLISHVMNSDALIEIKTFALKTKDAHSLYERFGFEKIGNSTLWMTKDNVVL
ncbi:GNAT family N-acetyltransferase [Sediminicola arcticus]|jgi:N-acetylglutamate synthase-like GNAT family acetyltransferase|uniref:GNAT family N-acetyltransferase n=1 Tax=Sediminicola arcticus TaxID=1574308 RepID=A0ABV2STQ1_9FLAO|tara:strand:- start:62 stop:478 length:417 start_codon:yes stop_codon:yes gene_type:complete